MKTENKYKTLILLLNWNYTTNEPRRWWRTPSIVACCPCMCECVCVLSRYSCYTVTAVSEKQISRWIQRRFDESTNQECFSWFASGDCHHSAFIQWVQFSVGDNQTSIKNDSFHLRALAGCADTEPVGQWTTFSFLLVKFLRPHSAGDNGRQPLGTDNDSVAAAFDAQWWPFLGLALVCCFTEHTHEALVVNIWTERRGWKQRVWNCKTRN